MKKLTTEQEIGLKTLQQFAWASVEHLENYLLGVLSAFEYLNPNVEVDHISLYRDSNNKLDRVDVTVDL